eukprot:scaffold120907_cov38-Prasinocladus_malaysianus.AAC.3
MISFFGQGKTLYSMTRDGVVTKENVNIPLESNEFIAGLEWNPASNRLGVLIRGEESAASKVLRVTQRPNGVWEADTSSVLTTFPLSQNAAILADRLLVLTELNNLGTYSRTTLCDSIFNELSTRDTPGATNPPPYAEGDFGDVSDVFELDGSSFDKANYRQ